MKPGYQLFQRENLFVGQFTAMACPCELLIATTSRELADKLTDIACQEAQRIENKFSRYKTGNIIHAINHSSNKAIKVDEETAKLLDFADQCYQLSEGRFDITSGILRRVWVFDGSNTIPEQKDIEALLPLIGWNKIEWKGTTIKLKPGMEIDLGGIGKEYAVDQVAKLIRPVTSSNVLINFGGDIYALNCAEPRTLWTIGIDDAGHTGENTKGHIQLYQGGVATSGDARRCILKDGIRYSHILNPLTGWPVKNTPHSVTVMANTCLEAGMLATFAMLEEDKAEEFLEQQGVKFYCQY